MKYTINTFAEASNTVSDPVLLGTIGVVTALIGGFFKVIQNQTAANERLSKGIDELTKSNEKIAEATIRSAEEARERNGHLGEQTEKIAKLVLQSKNDIQAIADRNYEAVKNIKTQTVQQQFVKKEIVDKSNAKEVR
jgi:hypothetical protein